MRILDDTKSITKNDPKKLTVADFWNITSAFVTLKEPAGNIEISFRKAIALDAKSVCSCIQMAGASNLEKAIPEKKGIDGVRLGRSIRVKDYY